jgi:protocatechuate 3,4-dioxygenase beta subunit
MGISRGALVLAVVAAFLPAGVSAQDPEFNAPPARGLKPVLMLAPAREPGERMIVTGRLFDRNTAAPLPRRRIGVYQTDASGNYGQDPRRPRWARLHGWLVTDSLGRYEIRTIRPGPYPGGGTPEHIHFVIETSRGFDGSTELRFEDDPRVPRTEREASRLEGRFATVRPVSRGKDGVLRVERDLRSP